VQRNASYDYARLIAAFGIVFFHVQAPGARFGYAALPFFLMLMIVMGLPAVQKQPFLTYARTRSQRLLRPWLIWSAIFGALKLLEVALTHRMLADEFALHMLITGPAIHLWFLPFALVACLGIYPIAHAVPKQHLMPLIGLLLALALVVHAIRQDQTYDVPLAQWAYVTPAIFLGLGLGLIASLLWAQIVVALGFVGIAWVMGWTDGLFQLGLACAALIACGLIRLPQTRASDLAAATALGVYLVHPLMISVLERTTSMTASVSLAVFACAMAWGFAFVWNKATQHSFGRTA